MPAAAGVTLFVSLAVLTLLLGLQRIIESVAGLDEQLEQQVSKPARDVDSNASGPAAYAVSGLDRRLRQFSFFESWAAELRKAGIRLSVSEYLGIHVGVVVSAGLLGALIIRHPLGGLVLGIVGAFGPRFYIKRRISKRLAAFEDQLEDVLTLLVGSLRAGYGVLQALDLIVEEIPAPASEEFKRVVREVGLGLSLAEALGNLVKRMDSMDLDMMVTAINIQQEIGGNLAVILETISETIRERVRVQGEIRVLTSQQSLTANILALLPLIVGGLIFMINPAYMRDLFTPGITLVVPAFAIFGVIVGFIVIRRIVDIDV